MPSSPASYFQNVPSLGRQNANSHAGEDSPSSSAGTNAGLRAAHGHERQLFPGAAFGGENTLEPAVSTFELLCLCHATTRRRSNVTPVRNVVTSVPVPSFLSVISRPLPNKCVLNTNRATSRSCASGSARAAGGRKL